MKDLQTQVVDEFCKLQRIANVAEYMFWKGQIDMMQKCLFESVQIGNKINALIGGVNVEEGKQHKEAD